MSSYRGDLSDSDRADLESWRPTTCRYCHGRGYVAVRGEPYLSSPCGCDEPFGKPPCGLCEGTGQVPHPDDPVSYDCQDCGGTGYLGDDT